MTEGSHKAIEGQGREGDVEKFVRLLFRFHSGTEEEVHMYFE